jgi:nucleotide-binding universal stress UspA family protein
MIVMGTHGASGMKELISGSHAEYVAMHVAMPVLTLKCERDSLEMKSIVLAGSFTQDDIPHCEAVLELQKAFDSKLHLLRVNTSGNFLPDHEAISHMKAFAQKHALSNVEYAVYSDHSLEDGIIQYAAHNDIDMIAIGSMQRTGLSKFIHGCVSADLVNHVFKPLLTFRLKDK